MNIRFDCRGSAESKPYTNNWLQNEKSMKGYNVRIYTVLFASIVVLHITAYEAYGQENRGNGTESTVDGLGNKASVTSSTIGGGVLNTTSGENSTVSGGYFNEASGKSSTVGGGEQIKASDFGSTVSGGWINIASGELSTVGGGHQIKASGKLSTVAGGLGNTASGNLSTVGGGGANTASGKESTVGGGSRNTAGGELDAATVGGGYDNTASGASSTVGGGGANTAEGDYSFAAGYKAKIGEDHDGTFLFADQTNADFNSVAANEFAARANGGVRFVTDSDSGGGVGLGSGDTSWNVLSDKKSKENYTDVNAVTILERVANLTIQRWNYRHQDESIQHIGPYAEDFHTTFGLHGKFKGTISSQDLDGVALAAIQGLNEKLTQELADVRAEKQTEIDRLEAELAKHDEQFASLEERLLAMEASMK